MVFAQSCCEQQSNSKCAGLRTLRGMCAQRAHRMRFAALWSLTDNAPRVKGHGLSVCVATGITLWLKNICSVPKPFVCTVHFV